MAQVEAADLAHLIGGSIDHLGVAVPDVAAATAFYRDVLGLTEVAQKVMPDDGLAVAFLLAPQPGLSVELIAPLQGSHELTDLLGAHTVQAFLRAQPQGGLHHICFRTADFARARQQLEAAGLTALGDGQGAMGASGKRVLFFAPTLPSGVLVEIKEVAEPAPTPKPAA